MPAIDFPAAPAVNDEYTFEGRTWLWNGTGWEVKAFVAPLGATGPSGPTGATGPAGATGATGPIGVETGTVMLFAQTAAPTGWTKITTHNDKTLRVVSGTASSGGTTAFTSVFASRTPAGTVDNTTLTSTQMPSHNHAYTRRNTAILTVGTGALAAWSGTNVSLDTDNTGGGSSHNHGFTGTAMDFAVQYVDVILASKD